jgi:quercetin dioxygenase-like cupin family protein
MAMHHAESGEVINILLPSSDQSKPPITAALIKTDLLEVIRMVVPAGKDIPPHKVANPITVQCLQGRVEFQVEEVWKSLEQGQMLFVEGDVMHAIQGIQNSTLLVSIFLRHKN